MPKYRILTFDGGGVRGVISARLIDRLTAVFPNLIADVDLFAGTSTGSILAIGFAKGITPTQMVQLYRDNSGIIFHSDILDKVIDGWGLIGAKYSTSNRYAGIHPVIGDGTLGDLNKKVLIATFQLDSENKLNPNPTVPRSWKPAFLHNFPGDDSNSDTKQMDAIMRSSAAPTFFPVYQGFVDGGVIANNPSMCALAQAINDQTGKQNIHDVVLLSVGTGLKPQFITSVDDNWGLTEWGFTMIDLLLETGAGLADYQCQQLLGNCYARLNVNLATNVGMDATDQVDNMIAIADMLDLSSYVDWVKKEWYAEV